MQRLTDNGMVYVHAGGTIIDIDLTPGETLRVDTGCIEAFSTTGDIQYGADSRTRSFDGG